MTSDVNIFNFWSLTDVCSFNFKLRMGSQTLVFVVLMSNINRYMAAELRSHHSNYVTLTQSIGKMIHECMYISYIKRYGIE